MLEKPDNNVTHDQSASVDSQQLQPVSKRIGNFASNLLVTGLILILGIAFGREVILWWRTDSPTDGLSPTSTVVTASNATGDGESQLFEFGDFPFALRREAFVGGVTNATERLRVVSREAIAGAEVWTGEVSDAERRMLNAARRLKPVEEQSQKWAIYQIDEPIPMVIGTCNVGKKVSESQWRVVSWGMAVPSVTSADEPQSDWTLFTYTSDVLSGQGGESAVLPTPPSGRRTVSLRTEHGGIVIGYAGDTDVAKWTEFYEALFIEHRDLSQSDWQVERGIWRRRFVTKSSEVIDVVICPDTNGSLRCLVAISQPSPLYNE